MSQETIFHKIINRQIPADIVYEDEEVLAFRDINAVAPTHILFIPKKTIPSLAQLTIDDKALLGNLLYALTQYAKKQGLDETGYRVVINTGSQGGQTVFQLHMHLLAGRDLQWPPG